MQIFETEFPNSWEYTVCRSKYLELEPDSNVRSTNVWSCQAVCTTKCFELDLCIYVIHNHNKI